MERIELGTLDHVVERQWRSSGGAVVKIGRVGERWFAWHSRKGAWVFHFDRAMAEHADKWLCRGGTWTELPVTEPAC
jgi:hypothetical protein